MSNSVRIWAVTAGALLLLAAAAIVYLPGSTDSASAQSASASAAPSTTSSKQCYSVPCYGNSNREVIYERIGDKKNDLIRAFGNYDRLHANTYSRDTDQLYGFGNDDFIYVDDGDTKDAASGGSGYDWCYVDATIEAANSCEQVITR